MSVTAKNPILAGFYPDPSICAVGDDFYLVNSSFAYFPGLPIMHSKDLAHWEQIGNVMDRASQLPLGETGHSRGLFAPTIRYHEGTFYVICTNVSYGGNFVVTATDPAGPWSEPHYLEGADGIDPSLFFDDDGKCYYIGTHPNPEGCRYDGDYYIWIQELDLNTYKLTGEVHNVWNGALRGVHWPEGPHLYKIDGYYYIVHAEGGTGPEHAVSVARSRDVFGPYENHFCNPIFTHRHLGVRYPIKYVGHADLFQTSKGEWYMVMLAVRPVGGYTTMGRETFLARVIWENGWPVVNPGLGILSDELKIDLPEWLPEEGAVIPGCNRLYKFTQMEKLGPEFLFLRNPMEGAVMPVPGVGLVMTCQNIKMTEEKSPSFVGIRQDSHVFEASAVLDTSTLFEGAKAGIVLLQSNEFHLRLEYAGLRGYVILCRNGEEEVIASEFLPENLVSLVIQVVGTKATLLMGAGKQVKPVASGIDICALSTEVAGGFVGCTIGMYATDEEKRENPVKAVFKLFTYRRITAEELKGTEKGVK